MVRHLPAHSWQPTVLTVEEERFTHPDHSLLELISPDVQVERTRALDPFALYRRFVGKKPDEPLVASETISSANRSIRHRAAIWIRMNLFVPDARIGWYWPSLKRGKELLRAQRFDAIVTLGPPHSTHLIGRTLSRTSGIPHTPVLIDPWVDIVYYKNFHRTAATRALDCHFERSVLEQSQKIVFITRTMLDDYVRKYPAIKDKSRVLYWGYSEEAFTGLVRTQPAAGGEEVILHAGNIFDYQNVPAFWKRLRKEVENGRKLKLVFVGTVSPGVRRSVTDSGLDPWTEYKGFLPYPDVVRELGRASALLVCTTERRHVPGKLFEYLRAGKPIIAFGDDNEEVRRILTESGAGMLFRYNEDAGDFFARSTSFRANMGYVRQFDRSVIAREFAAILDSSTT
jgi:glycosyltransferase involved in cell wall biosynthesis